MVLVLILQVAFGLFSVPRERLSELQFTGITVVHSYAFEHGEKTLEQCSEYLEVAQRYGLKVMVSIPSGLLIRQDRDSILTVIESLKNHPALHSWYLVDDTNIKEIDPEFAEEMYREIKRIDPVHPICMTDANIRGWVNPFKDYEFSGAVDVFMPDLYPIPNVAFWKLRVFYFLLRLWGQRFWAVIQTHNTGVYPQNPITGRLPSKEEMSEMAELALGEGSEMIWFYCGDDGYTNAFENGQLQKMVAVIKSVNQP